MGKVAAKDVGYDYTKLADPDEWKTNVAAGTKYLEKNAKDISSRGVPVTPLNMYLAHQQGAKGTADMLKAVADDTARTTPATTNQLNNLPPSYKKSITSVGNTVTVQNYYDYMSDSFKSVAAGVNGSAP